MCCVDEIELKHCDFNYIVKQYKRPSTADCFLFYMFETHRTVHVTQLKK